MLKPVALSGRLVRSCVPAAPDADHLVRLLDRRSVGVLTAGCCDRAALARDEALRLHLRMAMDRTGDDRPVVEDSLITVQRHMRHFLMRADEDQRALVYSVVALFEVYGLAIFPLLIIHGRVAFYGGVPDVEAIAERLARPARHPG